MGRRRFSVLWVVIVGGGITLMVDMAAAQYREGEIGGQVNAPVHLQKTPAAGLETTWLPSIVLQERYDSNVYFISGRDLDDYVTTISPRLRVVHRRPLIDATVGGEAIGEVYAKNPGLNYVGGNGLVDLNLSRAMNTLVRGLGLHVFDSIRYTPELPAFAAPSAAGEIPESAVLGIQARRANSYSNVGQVSVFYEVSPLLSLSSSYMDRRTRFGKALSPPGGGPPLGALIDITFQTVQSGPVLKVTPVDTLTLSHQYQKGVFGGQGSGRDFSTQGVMAGWTRLLSPALTASITGGVSVLDRNDSLHYVGSASLAWKGQDTNVTLSYSRVIAPSFYVGATALLSQIVRVTASRQLTKSLSVSVSGSYAQSESVPDRNFLQFDSYTVSPSLMHQISRMWNLSLSYRHSMFDRTFFGQGHAFDRDAVLLRLTAEWNVYE